jgi:hypothetical protein
MYKDADMLCKRLLPAVFPMGPDVLTFRTDNATTFIILFLVESGLGIIAASIPTLRPLFDRALALRIFSRGPPSRGSQPNHFSNTSGQGDPNGSAKVLSSYTQEDLEELQVLNSQRTGRLGFRSDSLEQQQPA